MSYTTLYSEIEKSTPYKSRDIFRNLALDSLSFRNKLLGFDRYLKKPRIQFLYIHHVFKDEIDAFDILIKELIQEHEFISYSEAVTKILSGAIDKPYITISSDDGFKNNMDAVNVLNKYGIKACFFINPITINLKDAKKITTFCKERLNLLPVEFMDWNDLEILKNQGHEIGSHTMNHINIAKTPTEKVQEEIKETYDVLKTRYGEAKHFAYPYGRFFHFNKEAMEFVFKTGFESCASAERGCYFNTIEKVEKENLLIRRDLIIAKWPLTHIKYFLIQNARQNNISGEVYPF
jgi:peptidoglycan/xylan/chitin deacetylase (PgdA/CDA1 family)